MKETSAIDWHSSIADEFDAKYSTKTQFIERLSIWKNIIRKYSAKGKSVIDVGCGSGVFSVYAASLNRHVVGVDGSDEMISLCKTKANHQNIDNIKFLVSEIYETPEIVKEAYDLIICSSVLEYTEDLDKSLATIDCLLKPGGVVILSMPNRSSLYRKFEAFIYLIAKRPRYYAFVNHVVTVTRMQKLFKKHGMTPIEHRYFATTSTLAGIARFGGANKYTANLFLMVARKAD